MKSKLLSLITIAITILISVSISSASDKDKDSKDVVTNGKKVSIEYTLHLKDGTFVESNAGKEPFTYKQGAHQIIPGLEKGIAGLKAGDKKHIEVSPAEGYGEVNPKAFTEIEKNRLPKDALKVGTMLGVRGENGMMRRAWVHEIKESTVVLDFNHPLAGKTLVFDIKVLKVE